MPTSTKTFKVVRRITFIIQYEPSWFAEFMSAASLFYWSFFAMISDDFFSHPNFYTTPALGLLLALTRLFALFRLIPELRVALAMANFLVWMSIFTGLYRVYGIVPAEGLIIGLAFGDVLTVGKFSLVSWIRHHAH